MPCYEINLISVEFKLKNKEILLAILRQENFSVSELKNNILAFKKNAKIQINLNSQTAKTNNITVLNKIKKIYSEKIIQQVAIKKKWLFKKISENKIQLNKY